MSEPTYSTGEVAKFLSVHIKTVLKWCKQGKIDAYTTSTPLGHWRITRTALVNYARQNGIPLDLNTASDE